MGYILFIAMVGAILITYEFLNKKKQNLNKILTRSPRIKKFID